MFEVYIGCEEWQDTERFDTLEEAQGYVSGWGKNPTLGLYTADEAWIDNLSTGERIFIEIGG